MGLSGKTGMSPPDQSKEVAGETTSLAQALDDDSNEGWRASFRKARFVVDDSSAPLCLREFWRAILESRRADAIRILDQLEKE